MSSQPTKKKIQSRKIQLAVKSLRPKPARSAASMAMRLTLRPVPGLSVEAISQTIREVKAASRERRASDEIDQHLMSMPVSV